MTPQTTGTKVTIWRENEKIGVLEATDEGVRLTSLHLTDGGQLFSFGEQLALVIVLTKERRGLKEALSRELSAAPVSLSAEPAGTRQPGAADPQ